MSPMITGRPWTAEEDAVIREQYRQRGGPQRCAEALNRSLRAVYQRGAILGLKRWRPWTRRDLAVLQDQWGETTLLGLAQKLGRTRIAVFEMAHRLGMSLGCPDGKEYLSDSAARVGYSIGGLRTLLERQGVKISRAMSRPTAGKKVRPRHFVDPMDVDEAVAAWCVQETLREAATRRHMDDGALARRLALVEGVPPKPPGKQHWRIPTELIERALRVA